MENGEIWPAVPHPHAKTPLPMIAKFCTLINTAAAEGIKMWYTSRRTEAPRSRREGVEGEGCEEGCPLPIRLGRLWSVVSSPTGVLAENGFYAFRRYHRTAQIGRLVGVPVFETAAPAVNWRIGSAACALNYVADIHQHAKVHSNPFRGFFSPFYVKLWTRIQLFLVCSQRYKVNVPSLRFQLFVCLLRACAVSRQRFLGLCDIIGQRSGSVAKKNSEKCSQPPPPPVGAYVESGVKKRDFWPIYHFISETIQDMDVVTMEDE